MLEVDDVQSEWSVLLAMTDAECVKLLSVVLDGFGYAPLECQSKDDVFEHLSQTTPFAAVVDARLDDSAEICQMVHEHGGVSLLVLLNEIEDPEDLRKKLQADEWQPVSAGPEKILLSLRKLATQGATAD
jgi:ActR/RegA family two-component response regulator